MKYSGKHGPFPLVLILSGGFEGARSFPSHTFHLHQEQEKWNSVGLGHISLSFGTAQLWLKPRKWGNG